jgi:hypothetical protein
MSASIMPFIAMMPRRRISSGWLLISCGRSTMRSRNWSRLAVSSSAASGLSERAVAEALCSLPECIMSSMPSCSTSV